MTRFLQLMVVLRLNQCATEPLGSPWSHVKQAGIRYCMFFCVRLVLSWFQFLFLFLMFPSC